MTICRKYVIESEQERAALWDLYYETFKEVDEGSPCKQSYNRDEFMKVLQDSDVVKFILTYQDSLVGIALITNNLKKVSWISEPYFKKHFPHQYEERRIYYIKALVIAKKYQGKIEVFRLVKSIIEYVDSQNGIAAFDCSENINQFLLPLIERAGTGTISQSQQLDRQVYYLVQ